MPLVNHDVKRRIKDNIYNHQEFLTKLFISTCTCLSTHLVPRITKYGDNRRPKIARQIQSTTMGLKLDLTTPITNCIGMKHSIGSSQKGYFPKNSFFQKRGNGSEKEDTCQFVITRIRLCIPFKIQSTVCDTKLVEGLIGKPSLQQNNKYTSTLGFLPCKDLQAHSLAFYSNAGFLHLR